jgi:hypothetical protein
MVFYVPGTEETDPKKQNMSLQQLGGGLTTANNRFSHPEHTPPDLICVDPERIFDFWPHARPIIKAAIDRTELSSFDDLEQQVLDGDQLLWLAWSDHIEAAATTHLSRQRLHADGLLWLQPGPLAATVWKD